MQNKAQVRAEAARLQAVFETAGASPVEADVLQPAGTLLDLYGEDIRARAFVTTDPLQGECMLRPDFTLPVVLHHMEKGDEPARFTYAGEVFRRQETADSGRQAEFFQVGYEVFDAKDPASADAEVFTLIAGALAPLGLRAAMGDIGLLSAAVQGLGTTERRRAALARHIWRPRRFRVLLDRFAGRLPVPPTRIAMLEQLENSAPEELIEASGPMIGLREPVEIMERMKALQAEAETPAISERDVALIDDLLAIRATPMNAMAMLRDMVVDMPSIETAVQRLEARFAALSDRGVDLEQIDFEASYGRTTLEYYDGFVFGLYAPTRPDLPPVASGGRYDALTRALGHDIPAVGGVIRPGLVLQLGAEQ